MKQLSITLISIFILSFSAFAQSELDNEKGTSMMPVINSLSDVVKAIEESDVEIVHIEFDLVFDDSSKEIYRNLTKDYSYGFLAYGDYRIAKIGIELYKETDTGWDYIKAGELSEGTVTLLYDVNETDRYKIVLRALQMNEGYNVGHYGLVVLHD
ncbi:MAG: hypothetical protein Q7U54_15960 [Bacteroidales bacterium]|nr:hypothetical protein [Bacteroidales bacterium]